MGSTIYSQKLKHPVYVSYTCEQCGNYNTFIEEIVGAGSAEVGFGSSNKRAQEKISKIGPKAQVDLLKNVQRAKVKADKGNYTWLKLHRCTKCNSAQSWQVGRLWKNIVKFIAIDVIALLYFFLWFSDASLANKTSIGAIGLYIILSGFVLTPIIILVVSLRKIGQSKHSQPEVTI